jgi:hypothetical protein
MITDLDRHAAMPQAPQASITAAARPLFALERGTAYVESVAFNAGTASVQLRYPMGRTVRLVLPTVPERGDARCPSALERVLSVDVRRDVDGVHCSAVGTSRRGPQRLPVTLEQALALAHQGVHAVFRAE